MTDMHRASAKGLITSGMRKPNFIAFVRAMVSPIDRLEDDGIFVALLPSLDAAGRVVGIARLAGELDESFGGFLTAQGLANRASGSLDDYFRVLELTQTEAFVFEGLAGFFIDTRVLPERVLEMLFAMKPGAIALAVVLPAVDPFVWDVEGFGSIWQSGTGGGTLAHVRRRL